MDWIFVKDRLPPEHEDVLCWDGVRQTVCYVEQEPEDDPTESNWYISWSMGRRAGKIICWRTLPIPPEVFPVDEETAVASVACIKSILANNSPEQIGADVGGQPTDYDLRVPKNNQPMGAQHPPFFADRTQKDK
jgi:hypothetical protein